MQLNWSNRWSNKQNARLQFGNAYLFCIFATALHGFTASKPNKQHNHTSFSTLLSDMQGTRSRASTSCADVHDSSGYKRYRRGSHHQEVSPLSSRVSAWCPLVQQLPQYRAVSKSALGGPFWCDVLWGDLGSIRPSAEQGWPSKTPERADRLNHKCSGLGFNECYIWGIEKHYKCVAEILKLAWGLS